MKDARILAIRQHLETHAKPQTGTLSGVRAAFERLLRELAKPEPDAIWLADAPCLACWLAPGYVFRVIGTPAAWSVTARPLSDRWSVSLDVKPPDGTHWTFSYRGEEFVTVPVEHEEDTNPPLADDRLTDKAFARLLSSRVGSPFGPAPLRNATKRRWLRRS